MAQSRTHCSLGEILAVLMLLFLDSLGVANAQGTVYRCTAKDGSVSYESGMSVPPECKGLFEARPGADGSAAPGKTKCMFSGCRITLQRQGDGHFYLDASINGQSAHFLVDTGASAVAVPVAYAQTARLTGQQMVISRTANGATPNMLVENVLIVVPGLPDETSRLLISPGLANDQKLLGQSYLSKFKISINGDRMEIQK
jgi:aspartyl protease family protein